MLVVSFALVSFSTYAVCLTILAEDFDIVLVTSTVARLAQKFQSIESQDDEDWVEGIHLACTSHNGAKVLLKAARA